MGAYDNEDGRICISIIYDCADCFWAVQEENRLQWECTAYVVWEENGKNARLIEKSVKIPRWCPLPPSNIELTAENFNDVFHHGETGHRWGSIRGRR